MWAITNARIHPVTKPVIERGTIVIRGSKIEAVGAGVAVPAGAKTIDAAGADVYPGFINARTTLGLAEPGPRGFDDVSEMLDFNPSFAPSWRIRPTATRSRSRAPTASRRSPWFRPADSRRPGGSDESRRVDVGGRPADGRRELQLRPSAARDSSARRRRRPEGARPTTTSRRSATRSSSGLRGCSTTRARMRRCRRISDDQLVARSARADRREEGAALRRGEP